MVKGRVEPAEWGSGRGCNYLNFTVFNHDPWVGHYYYEARGKLKDGLGRWWSFLLQKQVPDEQILIFALF